MKRPLALALAALLAGLSGLGPTGCALVNKDKRLLTRMTTAQVIPTSTTAKIATAPLWVPLGAVTLTADAVAVNPVLAAPAAADDAGWAFTLAGWFGPVELILIPVRFVGAVGIFAGSEVLRCTLPNPFDDM